uniref:Uncharacterized protein n=1 Tax=Arundo donax TaxID=35708 RepID=A0A0A9BU15_ARUDO
MHSIITTENGGFIIALKSESYYDATVLYSSKNHSTN